MLLQQTPHPISDASENISIEYLLYDNKFLLIGMFRIHQSVSTHNFLEIFIVPL